MEALVCILTLAHVAAYGAVGLDGAGGFNVTLFFEAALLLRAWRIALAEPTRAAVDAWLVGMLDVLLVAAEAA
ncbi:unnamed protein product [Polarella glacialis]|uniref:Uncharacterized protein n=1 Tax=Polarella glacialis TaxID=89957 RepID=A0A813JUI9_POLGL|nr:unnamed protein product [Polarella glacialis]